MKKYEIEIDGQVYHVKVKELPDDAVMPGGPKTETNKPAEDSGTLEEGKTMLAPMAGTILRILVKEGQKVKKGENLIVLEAMKMENEIVADEDGIVRRIFVKANDSVESDQPLLIL
ncbi:biotin-dependent enzyme [Trichococcus patagoniensis]|uniref:Biotin-dependent enzyme n=1 Tax=Trichococcus patagoniensis TaxID=382641 RepID=A0A2T5ICQ6_9LACT|nr:biotin/lipoyl-containing protein [Trichococcus patagoniensis]PTQ81594.1 biotin-dependent enzyme [Trichococcus patagoniensis]